MVGLQGYAIRAALGVGVELIHASDRHRRCAPVCCHRNQGLRVRSCAVSSSLRASATAETRLCT